MPTIRWKCLDCGHTFDVRPVQYVRDKRVLRCAHCQSGNIDATVIDDNLSHVLTGVDVQIQRMYRFDTDRPLKAFADIVVNDALLIKGIRVMDGKTGLFVTMPSEQAKDQKWYDTVRCLTQEIRDQITNVVLKAYKEA